MGSHSVTCHLTQVNLPPNPSQTGCRYSIYLVSWWRSIVVGPLVLPACFPYPYARLTAGRVTTLWVKRPLSVNQQGRLSLPSLRGRLNE